MGGGGLLKLILPSLYRCCSLNNIVLVNTVNVNVQCFFNRFGKILTVQVAMVMQDKDYETKLSNVKKPERSLFDDVVILQ